MRHGGGFVALVLLVACEGGSSRAIDEAGGVVTSGAARVEVPAGALSTAVDVSVTLADADGLAPLPAGVVAAGPAVIVTPHGQTFAAPVTIRVPLTAAADRVLRLDTEADTTWEVVEAELGADAATVRTSRFSVYLGASSGSSMCAPCESRPASGTSCASCGGQRCMGLLGSDEGGGPWQCDCDPSTESWTCCLGDECTSAMDGGTATCTSTCGLASAGSSCAGCEGGAGCAGGGSDGSYECACDATTLRWVCCEGAACEADAGSEDAATTCTSTCAPENAGQSCAGCGTAMCAGAPPEGESYRCECDAATERWVCT